jgi:hypothetical protein
MKTRMMWLLGVIVLLAVLFGWAPGALAWTAPYKDTDVLITDITYGTQTILSYSIYDPVRQQTISAQSPPYEYIGSAAGYDKDLNPLCIWNGVVCFCGHSGSQKDVYCSVYDPAQGQWVTTKASGEGDWTFCNDNKWTGTFLYVLMQNNDLDRWRYWAVTYDPAQGGWKEFHKDLDNPPKMIYIDNGVVAYAKEWSDSWLGIVEDTDFGMLVYDPRDGAWHFNEQQNVGGWSLPFWIDGSDTVCFKDSDGKSYSWGYDTYGTMNWISGIATEPLAYFAAQPNTGPAPLTVCLTDMSFGCDTNSWDLGDGNTSTEPSLWHTYTQEGASNIKQWVTNSSTGHKGFCNQYIVVQDVTPPTGGILINSGAPYTNSPSVTLNISTSSADPGSKMRFANYNSGPFTGWFDLQATKQWSLFAGDGSKNVFAQFMDAAGNLSLIVSAGINLDTTPPTGSISINGGAQYTNSTAVTLNLNAIDPGTAPSGVTQMWISNLVYSTLHADWVPYDYSVNVEPYATSKSWNLLPGDGAKRVEVCFIDAAGNFSRGYTADITLDSTKPPAGFNISINAGARYTNNIIATVYTDAGGQPTTKLKVSFGQPWGGGILWGSLQSFQHTYPIDLSSYVTLGGLKLPNRTVWARFIDMTTGNILATVSDTIDLDTVPPVDGVLTATGGNKQVTLNWSGFSDTLSGLKYFKLYCSTKGFPDVTKDPMIIMTGGTSYTHQNLQKGTRYYYRVVAMDYAGNVSPGVTAQARTKGAALPFLNLLLD